jgi:hypothetical protein
MASATGLCQYPTFTGPPPNRRSRPKRSLLVVEQILGNRLELGHFSKALRLEGCGATGPGSVGVHSQRSIGAGVEARLTAMIARWTLSSISGQSELWTTLTPFPRIRIVTWGCAPPCTTRESSNGPICLSVNLGASAHASSQMAGGSSAEHSSCLGALAERQQLSRCSKRDWGATIRARRRCRHADCTRTGGGNPRRRITISRLLRGAP